MAKGELIKTGTSRRDICILILIFAVVWISGCSMFKENSPKPSPGSQFGGAGSINKGAGSVGH